MKENILNGNYNDPFDRDPLAEYFIDEYAIQVQEIATNDKLKESYNKYFRKRRENQEFSEEESLDAQHDPRRNMRKVNIDSEPWDEDQSFIWPDYEAEAFENDLDQFRQRPESNTGYLNKRLNQIMRTRWGQSQVDKCIDNTLFKKKRVKESAQKRFLRKLKELDGTRGKFGIEVQLDPNKKYITQIVDVDGGLDIYKEPLEFRTKEAALDSQAFKNYSKKFGKNFVKVVKF